MQAGKLRHRIQIYSPVETRDANGGFVRSWNLDEIVWGSVEALSGKELIEGAQVNSQVTHKVTIRYRAGMTTTMRLISRDIILNIENVINPMNTTKELVIQCKQVTGQGPAVLLNDAGEIVFSDTGASVLV